MKIGTITFHWATNYGAILQAYALQKYLKINGFETEIINYIPSRTRNFHKLYNLYKLNFDYFIKEQRLKKFRNNELTVSNKYRNNKELCKHKHNYNVAICGSDQIWNRSFTMGGEGKVTLSYFLNFLDKNTKKISYAASFGTDHLESEHEMTIKKELIKFDKIGVRENTGKQIIKKMGLESTRVLDPTLLLKSDIYEELISKDKYKNTPKVFSYVIHENQVDAVKISDYVQSKYKQINKKGYYNPKIGLYEWLNNIKNSEFVVTNSFHGAVLSIILHTPFIIITVEDSKMNDRIYTILSELNLTDRVIRKFDENKIDEIINQPIDWIKVDERLKELRKDSEKFLLDSLKGDK